MASMSADVSIIDLRRLSIFADASLADLSKSFKTEYCVKSRVFVPKLEEKLPISLDLWVVFSGYGDSWLLFKK